MSRLSVFLLFGLLSLALALPFTARQDDTEIEDAEMSVSPEVEDDVCVDEKYLLARHARHELVHSIPFLAPTLCPGGGLPCGTVNHMVRINGKSMSYRQVCQIRDCIKKNVLVNSVLSHIWAEVKHDGITLTMFDARHPELPQKVLHWTIAQKRRIFG